MNQHKRIKSHCLECGRVFQGRATDINRGRVKYCSVGCRSRRVGRLFSVTKNPVRKLVANQPQNRPFIILTVCVGGYSRSPVIRGLLTHHLLKNKLDNRVSVVSGGILECGLSINHDLAVQMRNRGIDFEIYPPKKVTDQLLRSASLILTATTDVQVNIEERLRKLYAKRPSVVGKAVLFTSLNPRHFNNDPDLVDPTHSSESINFLLNQVEVVIKRKLIPALRPLSGNIKNVVSAPISD